MMILVHTTQCIHESKDIIQVLGNSEGKGKNVIVRLPYIHCNAFNLDESSV